MNELELKFDENLCTECETIDCLTKCQYIDIDIDTAKSEMLKVIKSEDSFLLEECATCYACEEYCPNNNHPFYLITERREDKDILTAAKAEGAEGEIAVKNLAEIIFDARS